ncbi:MAG TPA: GTP-binding protein [Candidatus Dormibacteraeota bacterium]|jgi:small GTP-binding protein|nr:GTP-binding protein [Candidatus Dormibacteraeota bacterium]
MGLPEKIKQIEEEMSKTQIHKHTEHHIGLLKAKLARLRAELEASTSKGGGPAFEIRKGGDATVVLIGLPSVGKSTILNRLTNAKSKVAAYAFTTLTVVPGILRLNGADIQILDLPGIISGASSGKGRGKRVLSVARNADLVLLVLDVFQPGQIELLKHELHEMGLRINQRSPDVVIKKSNKGGLQVTASVKLTRLSQATVKGIAEAYGVTNGSIVIREDINDDQLIDVLTGNRRYVPALVVLNKVDLVNQQYLAAVRKQVGEDFVPVSAEKGLNVEMLAERIWDTLDFIRIYLKRPDGEADYDKPLILPAGSTLRDVCKKIHPRFVEGAKYAFVSGSSVKFEGQRVSLDHIPFDKDVVTIMR